MPEIAEVEAPKPPVVVDPRADACAVLETAFAKRDWEAFYRATDALSRASFDMGRKKGAKYQPLNETPPEEPAAPPPEVRKEWSVGQVEASLIRFKREATVYTVVRGEDPTNLSQMVCFCDSAENADLIQRALAAYRGK